MEAAQQHDEPPLPLVSVCVINYNGEAFLRDCIGSILNQTYPNLEIVFCDDGSTDSSVALFEQMISEADRPISVVRAYSPENRGAESNMLLGLRSFTGEYVCNVDADDAISPVHVDVLVRVLRDGGCDIASTSSVHVPDEVPREWLEPPRESPDTTAYRTLTSSDVLPTFFLKEEVIPFAYWHRMYRREAARRVARLPDELFRNSDSAFSVLQFCEARTVAFLDIPTYVYRVHSQSMSHRSAYRLARDKVYGSLDQIARRYSHDYPELQELNAYRNCKAVSLMLHECVNERLGWHEYAECYRLHVTDSNRATIASLLIPNAPLRIFLSAHATLLRLGYYVFQHLRRFKGRVRAIFPSGAKAASRR